MPTYKRTKDGIRRTTAYDEYTDVELYITSAAGRCAADFVREGFIVGGGGGGAPAVIDDGVDIPPWFSQTHSWTGDFFVRGEGDAQHHVPVDVEYRKMLTQGFGYADTVTDDQLIATLRKHATDAFEDQRALCEEYNALSLCLADEGTRLMRLRGYPDHRAVQYRYVAPRQYGDEPGETLATRVKCAVYGVTAECSDFEVVKHLIEGKAPWLASLRYSIESVRHTLNETMRHACQAADALAKGGAK